MDAAWADVDLRVRRGARGRCGGDQRLREIRTRRAGRKRWIELDVSGRRLELLVPEAEIQRRLAGWRPPAPLYKRGYGKMYLEHVLQADKGCDFDYLRAC